MVNTATPEVSGILPLMNYPVIPHNRTPNAALSGQRVKLGPRVECALTYGVGPKAMTSVLVREHKEGSQRHETHGSCGHLGDRWKSPLPHPRLQPSVDTGGWMRQVDRC